MRTWDDYKNYVKSIDEEHKKDMEEIEALASIVGTMIEQRKALGISQ